MAPSIEAGVVIGPLSREHWAVRMNYICCAQEANVLLIKGKRCVVIGGAGFMGTHLVEQLARRDAQVVVFDMVKYRGTMPKVESVVGDLQDQKALESALQGAFVAFLVASPSPFLRDECVLFLHGIVVCI